MSPAKNRVFGISVLASCVLGAAVVTACFAPPETSTDDDDLTSGENNQDAPPDPLEGAYIKQGGTKLQFVFRRGDTKEAGDTYFGQIEGEDGESARSAGKIVVGRDNLGTSFLLTPKASAASGTDAGTRAEPEAETEADGDGGAPKATAIERLANQAFSGKVYYLKIGKNNSILVRKDATGVTAHYKKARSWCEKKEDCSAKVQRIPDLDSCSEENRTCSGIKCVCSTGSD